MTRFRELFQALQADFDRDEIKVLTAKKDGKGKPLRYATARTFMNRLDSVLGPENWWDEYQPINDNAVICRLTIRLPDGSTLTKSDVGGNAGMKDEGDDDKSGFSDAFKRACVKLGPGRHLYNDGMPSLRDAVPVPAGGFAQAIPAASGPPWKTGTAVPQAEAVRPPAVEPGPEPAGLTGDPPSDRDDVPFWDYLNDEVLKANHAYRAETGDGNGCVDVRAAVRTVVDMTHRAGKHAFDPAEKRTVKQWEQVVNKIAADPDAREWMIEYLRSHIKIGRETATLEASQGKR